MSTNSTTANAVDAFTAQGNDSLVQIGAYQTGGTGISSSGFSQGSVTLDKQTGSLFVVKAGPNQVSDFAVQPSGGQLSFAAVFTAYGQLLVADDGANGTSATSSHRVNSNGTLASTQPLLPDAQTAACWISLERDGNFFVSNAGSATMGSSELLPDGRLAFPGNNSAGSGAHPLDSAVSSNGQDLYVLGGNLDRISVFAIGQDAQLTAVGTEPAPVGSTGIAAS